MKNNHIKNHDTIEKIPLADLLEENQIIHWISTNGRVLLIAFFAIIALFFLSYRISFGNMVKSEVNFINAENDYQRFAKEKISAKQLENLDQLKAILSQMPELEPKYDGLIAQTLITENEVIASLPFATRAIDRTKSENSPFYSDFSSNTLTIAEQKYAEALTNALVLKQSLLNSEKSNELLFAYNLLRVASLQQLLNLEQDELNTWSEWKALANANINNENFRELLNQFNNENLSLTNYIETRENFLRKS